ncbi:MAG: hypothetical protein ACRD3O_15440 [Terriglobia bacterium]
MERVEKQKQLSHSFHRLLEISPKPRDFHTPTAWLRPGWESGKPKPGFPLSHAGLATTTLVSSLKTKKGNRLHNRLPIPGFQDHSVLETDLVFRIILGLENADQAKLRNELL